MSKNELALRDQLDNIGTELDKAVAVLQLLMNDGDDEASLASEVGEIFAKNYERVYSPTLWLLFDIIRGCAHKANDQGVTA